MIGEYEHMFFALKNGKKPFEEWYSSIKDKVLKTQVLTRLTRIKAGNFGDCKPVGNGVHELRIHYAAGYRIYFATQDEKLILLSAGNKAGQDEGIGQAKKYWKEFQGKLDEKT